MVDTGSRRTLVRGGAAALALIGALFLAGCGGDTVGPETGADVEDLQTDPDAALGDLGTVGQLVGQKVTVSALVSEVLGPNAFTIADQSGETVLVVYDGTPANLDTDTGIRVTGTVAETFAVEEAEEFVGADLDDVVFEDFDTDPYIQATSIDTTTSFVDDENG